MKTAIFFTFLLLLSYLVSPIALVWGWARWIKLRPRLWTISSNLALIGFALASASAVLALVTIAHASGGGFESNYSSFYRFVRIGATFSVGGILFATGGTFGKSSIRWHAPASAIGTLAFWAIATTWP